jgi:hypothetical protein
MQAKKESSRRCRKAMHAEHANDCGAVHSIWATHLISIREMPISGSRQSCRPQHRLHKAKRPGSSLSSVLSAYSACIAFLHLLRKSRRNAVPQPSWPGMSRHIPATSRDRFSLRMAGTCPAVTVEQHAAGIFTLSWCPRAGWGIALRFLLRDAVMAGTRRMRIRIGVACGNGGADHRADPWGSGQSLCDWSGRAGGQCSGEGARCW